MVGLMALPSSAGMIISTSGPPPKNFTTDANLQFLYNFEADDASYIYDTSGKGNDIGADAGTITDGTGCVKLGSKSGTFDGSTRVNKPVSGLSAAVPGKVSHVFTLMAWIKPANHTVGMIWTCATQPLVATGWQFQTTTGANCEFDVCDTTPTVKAVVSAATYTDNTCFLAFGTWDGSYINLYTNLASAGTIAADGTPTACTSMYTSNTYLYMGGYNFVGTLYLPATGSLETVCMFDRVLTLSEMQSILDHKLDGSQ